MIQQAIAVGMAPSGWLSQFSQSEMSEVVALRRLEPVGTDRFDAYLSVLTTLWQNAFSEPGKSAAVASFDQRYQTELDPVTKSWQSFHKWQAFVNAVKQNPNHGDRS